ncbi:low-affinity phosphate transporter PitH [Streptomyces sodiiphilus]|uniref:Low-affinity phosphate transporter PitH n=1 Tax=Streptomyces sodiiphilus TaxID=226217 RepID=A0ABN2PU38_9ACTN
MDTWTLVVVVAAALFFTCTNGFRDASITVATSVSTRSLTPGIALLMAALMNFAGAFLGTGIARTVGERLVDPPDGLPGLLILLAALAGAMAWHVITWYVRLPAASTHALLGALAGAVVAGAGVVHWDALLTLVVLPLLAAPVAALLLAYLTMVGLLWAFRRANPHRAQRGFRIAQTVSAAGLSLGHGLQDAQKTMGVVVLALVVAGTEEQGASVPLWVRIACATALAAGTWAGGGRLVRTLGRRVIQLDPPRGHCAETAASAVLYTSSYLFQAPVSTTHVITSANMGVVATRRLSAVRWAVARSYVMSWLVTLPAAAAVAAVFSWLLRAVFV